MIFMFQIVFVTIPKVAIEIRKASESSTVLLDTFDEPMRRCIGVDAYDQVSTASNECVTLVYAPNATLIRGIIADAIATFSDGSIDLDEDTIGYESGVAMMCDVAYRAAGRSSRRRFTTRATPRARLLSAQIQS